MKRKLLTSFFATILLVSGILVAPLTEPESASASSLGEIRAKKKQKQSELSKVRNQRAKVQKEVNALDAQMTKTTNEIVKKEDEVIKNEKEVKKLGKEIKEAEVRIAERDEILKERVRSMHVNGGAVSYIEVLLGAKSFGDFLDRVFALNVIAEQDRTIIEEQKADKQILEENKAETEKLITKIEAELVELDKLKDNLIMQMAEKEEMLASISAEEEVLDAQFKGYVAEERTLQRQLQASRSNSGGTYRKSKGIYLWPAAGRLSSGFGMRVHPISGKRKPHSGIDIANSGGTPIRAAAEGKVIHAASGWNGGYGTSIKIKHKNGHVTHYAHLSALSVKKGQTVSAGQTIGLMGTTGSSTGNHLHFEVIVNGVPQNPLNYL